MIIIIGLGNYGDEYTFTRHNIGWLTIEALLTQYHLPDLVSSAKFSGLFSEGNIQGKEVGVLLPTTFMNNSGNAVLKYLKKHEDPDVLIVVHDDVDLLFGEVKISFDRGAGGHNGVRSIIDILGSQKFARIRVGIAQKGLLGNIKRPKGDALSNYVLAKLKNNEIKALPEVSNQVIQAVTAIIEKGIQSAMQEVNGKN